MREREIKFRARSIENGKTWYEGHYYIEYGSMSHPIRTPKSPPPAINDTHWIVFPSFADWGMPREMQRVQVDPKTVGQFIGLKDKNGKEIYEGDIVKTDEFNWIAQVIYNRDCFMCIGLDGTGFSIESNWENFEVIDNIYENKLNLMKNNNEYN